MYTHLLKVLSFKYTAELRYVKDSKWSGLRKILQHRNGLRLGIIGNETFWQNITLRQLPMFEGYYRFFTLLIS